MNELKLFENPQFGQVRTVTIEDKPYFVAKDVATALGYADTTNAIKQHCRGVAKHHLIDNLGREQEANVIPEGDIYRLVARSKLPAAEKYSVPSDTITRNISELTLMAIHQQLDLMKRCSI